MTAFTEKGRAAQTAADAERIAALLSMFPNQGSAEIGKTLGLGSTRVFRALDALADDRRVTAHVTGMSRGGSVVYTAN